ncbi:MAG: ATP-dependent Clp protease adaptor ClpS, partial [Bacteroidota bacterium]|nr:ATP-dependent Clp protease adaptor ClpS [Bacteroidota bacterium]
MTKNKNEFNPNPQNENNITKKLVLFNDEENSFDFVIDSLMKACDYSDSQAEQLTILAHYKGEVAIKEGNTNELLKIQNELQELGLNVKLN